MDSCHHLELFAGHWPLWEPSQRGQAGRQEEERWHGTRRGARLRRRHEASGKSLAIFSDISAELGQNAELDQNSVELAEILPELETIWISLAS